MGNYYYLVPTLPMLRMDMSDYMTFDEFLARCKGLVSEGDYKTLSNATLSGGEVKGNRFLAEFSHFRSMVEKELAAQRAARLSIQDERYVNKGDKESRITEEIRKAVACESPLEAEKIILQLYWDYLETHVSSGHYFDLTFLISYALRLQILSRQSQFTTEKGNEEFSKVFSTLKAEIFPAGEK